MFDVFLVVIIARALVISAHRRFLAGFVAVTAAASLWLGLAAAGWLGRGADGMPLYGAWLLVCLGPSAVPAPTPWVPGSGVMASHAVGTKAVIALVLVVPFVLAWSRAAAWSPLSDHASAQKKLGLVYLVPVLLVVVQVVLFELGEIVGGFS
jgi:hypothetical protein